MTKATVEVSTPEGDNVIAKTESTGVAVQIVDAAGVTIGQVLVESFGGVRAVHVWFGDNDDQPDKKIEF